MSLIFLRIINLWGALGTGNLYLAERHGSESYIITVCFRLDTKFVDSRLFPDLLSVDFTGLISNKVFPKDY
jgi:hypothetical protein